jgi:hypothetical protein
MVTLLLGKPLVFWLGLLVLVFFIAQVTLGIMMTAGKKYGLLKYHKVSALILCILVVIHILYGLSLYFNLHL